jgi:hypothetical protein
MNIKKFNNFKINENIDINQFKSMIEFKLYQKFKSKNISIETIREIISFFEENKDDFYTVKWYTDEPKENGIYISDKDIILDYIDGEWYHNGITIDAPDKWRPAD